MKTFSPENFLVRKTLSLLACVLLAAHLPALAQCISPPSGLVAWWPGEGNASDLAGANNGALVGGVTFVTGEVGEAFSFDGYSGYIDVSNTPGMDFGTNDFSIACWIRLASLDAGPGGGREIIHKSVGDVPSNRNYTYFLEYDAGPALRFRVSDTNSVNDLTITNPLSTGVWYHVAAVRMGNTNQIYLNGLLLSQQVSGSNINSGIGGTAYIGEIAPNGIPLTRFFDGQIDELSLFNRALSQSEIGAIYAAGSAGMCHEQPLLPPQNLTAISTNLNRLLLQFTGSPNSEYELQATTNLSLPVIWQPVLTNPSDESGNWHATITNLPGVPIEFFRAFGQ